MKTKKVFKIIAWVFGVLLIGVLVIFIYANYLFKYKFMPRENSLTHSAEYISPDIAYRSENFEVCNEDFIIQYYNPERATYSDGKNGLRKFILSNYKNNNYTDSGYINFRFIINCKGEAGRYIIHENSLDLEPKTFNPKLIKHLFLLTTQLKKWNPNYTQGDYRDSYMYISYRIEHGEITEIIP